MNTNTPIKIALTGDVALELVASYFKDAGYAVMPQDVTLDQFRPDFVYDVTRAEQALAEEIPGFYDRRMEKLSGCRFSAAGLRAIVDEFAWFAAARPAKVLAVDADNTLWGGILSEDGPDALVHRTVFQAGLRAFSEAGVVLTLVSKNDEEALVPVLDAARLTVFSVVRANWEPKAGNVIEACRQLNLDVSSVVFLDDNPHERAQMAAHLPTVCVAPWSGWRAEGDVSLDAEQRQLLRRLKTYFFSDAGRTAEDGLRAADYRANGARRHLLDAASSRDAYLDDLDLWVRPRAARADDLDRLAQMAGKTNQFNATTLRRTRDDFARLLADPDRRVFVFRAGDRFGEQGLVCYLVADLARGHITDFVMSCRAMGRTLEHFALAYADRVLGRRLEVDFVPTAKNRPFAAFRASLAEPLVTHFKEVD